MNTCTCVHVFMCIHVHVYMCTHVLVYTHMHAHLHTHSVYEALQFALYLQRIGIQVSPCYHTSDSWCQEAIWAENGTSTVPIAAAIWYCLDGIVLFVCVWWLCVCDGCVCVMVVCCVCDGVVCVMVVCVCVMVVCVCDGCVCAFMVVCDGCVCVLWICMCLVWNYLSMTALLNHLLHLELLDIVFHCSNQDYWHPTSTFNKCSCLNLNFRVDISTHFLFLNVLLSPHRTFVSIISRSMRSW